MRLRLTRKYFTDESTIGELTVDGSFECFTLEDKVRDQKVWGKTAIPAGTYDVAITHSRRFNRELPELQNVPGYAGVRVHTGNCPADTEGCILVGKSRSKDWVSESVAAFGPLFEKMREAARRGEKITIEVG